ncbi:bifunctional 3,4-dihydroxy-2-butanone-4-phosphate synthase/GTP cyclohydrolase II [Amycolatopsis acidiphila]|uniref:Riboflavin biosynthesis protein RibBA n=2 Tax=Amycolatopsis acidiphila TaxID=715473 RepID=A0A558AIQ4_9PSEU|nr:bifunctional 3,4-dihydroxy-2-butanone-4-phosphate synthase/GTP cyclohydrolase II [Amycolatopsis acidiphila]TVT24150.1 bifunctional 3,4-dihydroxy-2-butanone-4-phosphate synthase/GTP cyclohydrolase II [Amycolatopsis acidiphila]
MSTVEEAVAVFAAGGAVVVLDDEDRENEADLIMAAEHATPRTVAFFLEHTSGFLCVSVSPERADELGLDLMTEDNTEAQGTAFLVSVDARTGTTTGISAGDRAATCRALADVRTRPEDLARPGHVLPLRARPGGVLKRAGHTEAGVDLCSLAGLAPAALLCEMVTSDRLGMLRGRDAVAFARRQNLPVITIADLVRHRRASTRLAERSGEARVATPDAEFQVVAYRSVLDDVEHLALVLGDVADGEPVLARVHSECLTGDLFGSLRCDCGPQLRLAVQRIAQEGRGVIVYLRGHEGRGIGIGHKLRAYQLQEQGLDTVDANTALGLPVDTREYGIGAEILADLGVREVLLMTNNPHKYGGLDGHGVRVTGRVPLQTEPTRHNIRYLVTKRDRMGHLLDLTRETTA